MMTLPEGFNLSLLVSEYMRFGNLFLAIAGVTACYFIVRSVINKGKR